MDRAEAFELLYDFVKRIAAEREEWSLCEEYPADVFTSGVTSEAEELVKRIHGN